MTISGKFQANVVKKKVESVQLHQKTPLRHQVLAGDFSLKSTLRLQHSPVSHMAKTQSKPLLTRLTGLFTENELTWFLSVAACPFSSAKTNKDFLNLTKNNSNLNGNIFNIKICAFMPMPTLACCRMALLRYLHVKKMLTIPAYGMFLPPTILDCQAPSLKPVAVLPAHRLFEMKPGCMLWLSMRLS